MNKMYIQKIYDFIMKEQDIALFDFMLSSQNIELSTNDLQGFIDLFNPYHEFISEPIEIGLSGSGGSGLKKPNIGTIASMYLAQVPGVTVAKVGSKRRTSLMGSTDFLSELGYHANVDKVDFFRKWRFLAADVDECAKWRRYEHILRLNNSFNYLLDTYLINEFSYKTKFTGTIFLDKALEVSSMKTIHNVNDWYIYGGLIGENNIDELVCGKNIVIHNNRAVEYLFDQKNYKYNADIDVYKLNSALIRGECADDFWLCSLENTFSLSLYLSGRVDSRQEATDIFKNLYYNKALKDMLNDMGD